MDEDCGALTVENLPFTIRGVSWSLTRPLNSREPWPLYAETEDECVRVFTNAGDLTEEFLTLIGARL